MINQMQPKPGEMNTNPGDKLPAQALVGDALNLGGTTDDTTNSLTEKLKKNKKSLPGVGFKPPVGSSKSKKAVSSLKKMKKKAKK